MSQKRKRVPERPKLHPENEAFLARLHDKPLDSATVTSVRYGLLPIFQRQNASGSRQDSLSEIIEEILVNCPDANSAQVLKKLTAMQHGDTIESVTDTEIEWVTAKGKIKETPIAAVKDRIYRIRKRLEHPPEE